MIGDTNDRAHERASSAQADVCSNRTAFDGRWFPLLIFRPRVAPALLRAAGLWQQFAGSGRIAARWWYNRHFPETGTLLSAAPATVRARCLGDLMAGIVVATLLIPSGMAYAMLAGLPPQVGIYASIVPLVVYAALGASSCLSIGPVTVVSLLVGNALAPFAVAGSATYLANAIALAALSGICLIAMGCLRLGFLVNLLSHSVLLGFTTGVGIVIVVNQLKTILGVVAAGSDFLPLQLWNIVVASRQLNVVTLLIGSSTIAALWFRREFVGLAVRRQLISQAAGQHLERAMPLVVTVAGAALTWLFGWATNAGVTVVGSLPFGLMPLTWPIPADVNWVSLIPSALLLSLIGFVEGISIAKRLEPVGAPTLDIDRELIAVGVANLAAACTGGYPVSGGTARTALNRSAGAVTPLANAWSAVVVLLCLLLFAPFIYHLPTAVLAAIIITACASLINFKAYTELSQTLPSDGMAFALTCVATICAGAKWGLAVGIAASIGSLAHRAMQAQVITFVDATPHACSLQVIGWLNFANATTVERQIMRYVTSELRCCTVRLDPAHASDASGFQMLAGLKRRLATSGIELSVEPPLRMI